MSHTDYSLTTSACLLAIRISVDACLFVCIAKRDCSMYLYLYFCYVILHKYLREHGSSSFPYAASTARQTRHQPLQSNNRVDEKHPCARNTMHKHIHTLCQNRFRTKFGAQQFVSPRDHTVCGIVSLNLIK